MRLLIPFFLLLSSGGCLHTHAGSSAADESATVKISSHNFLDIDMYVYRDGQRLRLGTVVGNGTEEFTIPESFIRTGGTLRFVADPIGSPQPVFDQTYEMAPGDHIFLIIPPV